MKAGRPAQFPPAQVRQKPGPCRGVPARPERRRKSHRCRRQKRPYESVPYRFARQLRARAAAGREVFPTACEHGFRTHAHPARLLVFLPVPWTAQMPMGAIAMATQLLPPPVRAPAIAAPMRAHPAVARAAHAAHYTVDPHGPHCPTPKWCARPRLGAYSRPSPNLRADRHTKSRQMAACRACSDNRQHRGGRARGSWRHKAGGALPSNYRHRGGLAVLCHIHRAHWHWRATAHRRQRQNTGPRFVAGAQWGWHRYRAKTQPVLPAPWPHAPSSPARRGFAHPYRA